MTRVFPVIFLASISPGYSEVTPPQAQAMALVDVGAMTVVSREIFQKAPSPDEAVLAQSCYTSPSGLRLQARFSVMGRSDTMDYGYTIYSEDNGETWGEATREDLKHLNNGIVERRHFRAGVSNPVNHDYVLVEGIAMTPEKSDSPLNRNWQLYYSVSDDGGHRFSPVKPMMSRLAGSSIDRPFPGVSRTSNPLMQGDLTCAPMVLSDGRIILPAQRMPLDSSGRRLNPMRTPGFYEPVILEGTRVADREYHWEIVGVIPPDIDLSARGFIEPTIARLSGARWICVMRGTEPGRARWVSFSSNEGRLWSKPVPWSFNDGLAPYSPSSCSQLLEHSGGKLFWIGNLCENEPKGNSPRYPLWIVEVDRATGLMVKSTLSKIDEKEKDEADTLTLSNFFVREDRVSGNLIVHLTRLFGVKGSKKWGSDALLYRVAVK